MPIPNILNFLIFPFFSQVIAMPVVVVLFQLVGLVLGENSDRTVYRNRKGGCASLRHGFPTVKGGISSNPPWERKTEIWGESTQWYPIRGHS